MIRRIGSQPAPFARSALLRRPATRARSCPTTGATLTRRSQARRAGRRGAELGEQHDVGGENARFTLEVRRSNSVAIHLYEREGFRAAGMRRRYYQDNGEDALVMWRTPATLSGSLDDVPNPGPV